PRVSKPAPQLASVVLATSDFAPGAHVAGERPFTVAGQSAFIRVFKSSAKLGGQPLSLAVGIGLLEQDAATAQADFADLQHETQRRVGKEWRAWRHGWSEQN